MILLFSHYESAEPVLRIAVSGCVCSDGVYELGGGSLEAYGWVRGADECGNGCGSGGELVGVGAAVDLGGVVFEVVRDEDVGSSLLGAGGPTCAIPLTMMFVKNPLDL